MAETRDPDVARRTRPVHRYQPLVPVALALVAGILVGEYVGGTAALWCVAAVAAAGAWLLLRILRRGDRWLLTALLALVAAAGAAWYHAGIDPPPDDVARLSAAAPRLVAIEGILVRSPRQSAPPGEVFLPAVAFYTRSTMAIDCERVRVDDTWYAASGRVQTVVRQPQPQGGPPVRLGDRVQVVGLLMPPGRPANPGAFDVSAYLRTQGIRGYLRTDEWDAVRVVEPAADRLRALVGIFQRWAVARLAALPTEEGRGVVAAMLFGRRDMLDFDTGQTDGEDLQHAFLATGTVHYMAVSGFNVALVVAPVLVLLRLLGAGRRLTAVVVALVVLAFVMMTELEPPVLRAAILFWVLCVGWMWGREPSPANTLAAAVIGVLVVRPGDLFSMSFQLSFLAVLGMMFVVGRLEKDLLGRLLLWHQLRGQPGGGFLTGRVLRGMLMVSVAATLITAPLIAGKFHILAWTSPLASAVLLPLVFVLTVFGMVQVTLGWVNPWLDAVLALPLDAMGRLVAAVVKGLAHIPGSYMYVGEVSPLWILAAYAVLALWVWRDRLRWPRRRVAVAALAVAAAFIWTGGHRDPPTVRATFLAVGNGNTTLLELPGGRTLLYDAGSSVSNVRAAESTIAPALWACGVGHVDAVLISHPHFDHFKDILPLVERFGIRQAFLPPTFMRGRLSVDNGLVEALQARGVTVTYLGAGDCLAGAGPVEVRAVWPRGQASQTRALNDGSLVVSVEHAGPTSGPSLPVRVPGRRLLLTGDLMPAGMAALAAAEPDLRADAMLWPHHGHDAAAVGSFAAKVGARVLIVSAGRLVAPAADPPWFRGQGVTCYRTGESGAVTLDLGPQGLRVGTFLRGPVTPEPEPEPATAGDDD